jgi:outer membrane protein TolC
VRLSLLLLTSLGLPGVALAQEPAAPAAQPPVAGQPATGTAATAAPQATLPTTTALPIGPTPDQPLASTPQPSAATPPTPLPKKTPDTGASVGVKPSDIVPTRLFQAEGQTPGQRLPEDPQVIRTLDDAIAVAFRRSPSILLAQERALRTVKQVDQILAIKRPQVSVGGTYARLANANSNAQGGQGASPAQLQNPFQVGLQVPTPGSAPVQLSTTQGLGGGAGAGGAGLTNATVGAANAASAGLSAAQVGGGGGGVGGVASGRATALPEARDDSSGSSRQNQPNQPNQPQQPGQPAQGGGDFTRAFNTINLNQIGARFSISQLIDVTGLVRVAEQLGDLGEALSRVELARTRQQTALDVKNSYFNLLRAVAFVRVNEAAVAQSEELLRVTRVQETAGVASRFDVLRSQTQLDNNRQALISSRNQVAIARNALANTIGIDPSTPVDPQPLAVPPLPELNEETLLTTAFTQRPEYIQADLNYLIATKNIRLARRNMEPFVNAGINGNYNATPQNFVQNKATAAFALTLTVPLSDGGVTRAAVDAARSDERGALIQKDQFVRGIKAEVQQSVIAVRDANERSLAIVSTVAQAQEALRLANVRFRAGVGTQLDVNDAQTALIQAQTNQVSALFDYLGALARLQRAVGTPQ